jgi:FSR family fosmidomycin resistance protein-like MFS transporter
MKKINPFVYLFAMGHFATDWSQGAIPALLPYFITTCHLNYQEAGSLIFANMLLASIAQPFFGYYSDKISKPWFIPGGTCVVRYCLDGYCFYYELLGHLLLRHVVRFWFSCLSIRKQLLW